MNASAPSFLWLPALAVALHLVEEFVWPGGFAEWYRWYHPERAVSVTTRYSPSVITGTLAYLPLGVLGYLALIPTGIVAWATAVQAIIVGVGFHVWSAWNHKRRAAAQV